jgi:dolichyl-phosphate-mannose--protein O-mannosyl transferase
MKKNMSKTDGIIRLVIAAVLGFLYYNGTLNGTLGLVLVGVVVIAILTSFVNFCPLYALLGISTCKVK